MENQKIQQLIRLASIADNNGDYKIADKIFTKMAQLKLPPRLNEETVTVSPGKIFKTTNLSQFLEMMTAKLGPLIKKQQNLETLIKRLEPIMDKNTSISTVATQTIEATEDSKAIPGTVKKIGDLTDLEMDQALKTYKIILDRLQNNEQELVILRGMDPIDQNAINGTVTAIKNERNFIDTHHYVELFGNDPANPITKIPLSSLRQNLDFITSDINKELPDPSQMAELAFQFKNEQGALERLKTFFNKINTKAADELLDKIKLEEAIKDKNPWSKFWARRGASFTRSWEKVKSAKDFYQQVAAERKAVSNFNNKGVFSPESLLAYFRMFYKQEAQEFGRTFGLYIQALDKELVYTYIKKRELFISENKITRKNLTDNELEAILKLTRVEVAKSPVGSIITGLFEAMKKNFDVLKEAAKADLLKQSKADTPENILARMIRLDGKFMKNTGISPEFAYKLIQNENLSIEEFMKSKGNPVIANLRNEKIIVALAVLVPTAVIGGFSLKIYLNNKAEERKYLSKLQGPGKEAPNLDKDLSDLGIKPSP